MKKKKVLVLQLSRLGDLLQSTLLFNSLKKTGYTIYVLGDEKNHKIAKEIDLIDVFIPFQISKYLELIKQNKFEECFIILKDFIDTLNKENFDEIYNLNHSPINELICYLIKVHKKIGFKVEKNKFIDLIYSLVANRSQNRFNLVDIFNHFFSNSFKNRRLFISLYENEKNRKFADKVLFPQNIVFHLGAGHKLREWGAKNFAELGKMIIEQYDNIGIILTGTKGERELGREFVNSLETNYKRKIINLIGKTDISLLKSVLLRSNLIVSTDTGVMHLASACNINIIALFYASAYPFETGPYTEKAIVLSPNIKCYPCTEFKQLCSDIKCKEFIKPTHVFQSVSYFLENMSFNALKEYAKGIRDKVIYYQPYFDEFGICYKNILEG